MSLLTTPENKYDFFNVRFPETKDFGTRQYKAFWMPTDVSYSEDTRSFATLDDKTKRMVEMTIGFFFSSDGIVFSNLSDNFENEFEANEVKYTYSAIKSIELIHAESYGLQLDNIGADSAKKKMLMMAIEEIPAIKRMADWAHVYMNRDNYTLIERLIAFLCVEGIFFSSPFAFIFWIRKYHPGKVEGIVAANDLIARDENLHCEFGVHLINSLRREGHNTDKGEEIIRSSVEVALNFVRDTLTSDFLDMNVDLMSRHVKSVANRWATLIGFPLLYPDCKQSPFKFIENLSLEVKKNFFEKSATEYQKAPPMNIDFLNEKIDENW